MKKRDWPKKSQKEKGLKKKNNKRDWERKKKLGIFTGASNHRKNFYNYANLSTLTQKSSCENLLFYTRHKIKRVIVIAACVIVIAACVIVIGACVIVIGACVIVIGVDITFIAVCVGHRYWCLRHSRLLSAMSVSLIGVDGASFVSAVTFMETNCSL